MAEDRRGEAATLSALLEALPAPALIVDAVRRVRGANAALRARAPGGPGFDGARCYQVLHARRRRCPPSRCPLDLCVGSGAPVPVVHAHVVRGRRCRELALLRPLVDDAGRVVACLATLEPLPAAALGRRATPIAGAGSAPGGRRPPGSTGR